MNSKQFTESTTSGAIASVSTPVGNTQTRGKGVYPNKKGGNLLTGKETNKKFPNTVKESQQQGVAEGSEETKVGIEAYGVRGVNSNKWKKTFKSQEAFEKWLDQNEGDVEVAGTREVNLNDMFKESMKEAKLDEEDVIVVPGQGNRIKPGFIPRDKDRTDHEVEMAKSDLFQANKNAKKIYELIKDIPETVGLEGWVQEKIIKANDYLNTIREYLEHKQVSEMTGGVIAGGGVGEGVAEGFPYDLDHMPGKTTKHTSTNCTTCHGRKSMYKLGGKLFADNKQGATKVKCPTCKGTGDKRGVNEMFADRGAGHPENQTKADREYVNRLRNKHMPAKPKQDSTKNKEQKGVGKGMAEGYRVLPSIDRERYGDRSYEGLEGPFRARNGKVYYYDPKAGMAYDPDTDFYIDYDDLRMMDTEMSEGSDYQKPKLGTIKANLMNSEKPTVQVRVFKHDSIRNEDYWVNKGIKTFKTMELAQAYADRINKQNVDEGVDDTKKKISKYEELALAANRAGDDEKCKLYQRKIQSLKQKMTQNVDEGILGKVLGGAALIASLWGIGQNQAQQVYDNSPQLQTLIKYHQKATQMGDEAKIQELERRIENQKTRLSVGKGEVMGPDDKPIVPSFESSVIKGMTDESSYRTIRKVRSELKPEDDLIPSNKPELKGIYFFNNVTPELAKKYSKMKPYKNNKWGIPVYTTSGATTQNAITLATKEFGPHTYWEPKPKSFGESKCPECGGKLVAESELNEEGNKDACYHKVKSRYKVWPSAYASGALVKCRKVGASNWGNKSK